MLKCNELFKNKVIKKLSYLFIFFDRHIAARENNYGCVTWVLLITFFYWFLQCSSRFGGQNKIILAFYTALRFLQLWRSRRFNIITPGHSALNHSFNHLSSLGRIQPVLTNMWHTKLINHKNHPCPHDLLRSIFWNQSNLKKSLCFLLSLVGCCSSVMQVLMWLTKKEKLQWIVPNLTRTSLWLYKSIGKWR